MAIHSMRGQLGPSDTRTLIMDDGIFTQGHVITKLTIIGGNNGSLPAEVVLSYSSTMPTSIDFEDSDQIGWALWDADTTTGNRHFFLIDPEHAGLQDLFIHSLGAACNYLVELQPVDFTEAQGVLQLIKHARQA